MSEYAQFLIHGRSLVSNRLPALPQNFRDLYGRLADSQPIEDLNFFRCKQPQRQMGSGCILM